MYIPIHSYGFTIGILKEEGSNNWSCSERAPNAHTRWMEWNLPDFFRILFFARNLKFCLLTLSSYEKCASSDVMRFPRKSGSSSAFSLSYLQNLNLRSKSPFEDVAYLDFVTEQCNLFVILWWFVQIIANTLTLILGLSLIAPMAFAMFVSFVMVWGRWPGIRFYKAPSLEMFVTHLLIILFDGDVFILNLFLEHRWA